MFKNACFLAIDSAGTRLAEIVSESSTLRLTSRNDPLLGHEMVGQASAATAPMVSDLRAYGGVPPYGCFLAARAAVLDCTTATLEGGARSPRRRRPPGRACRLRRRVPPLIGALGARARDRGW